MIYDIWKSNTLPSTDDRVKYYIKKWSKFGFSSRNTSFNFNLMMKRHLVQLHKVKIFKKSSILNYISPTILVEHTHFPIHSCGKIPHFKHSRHVSIYEERYFSDFWCIPLLSHQTVKFWIVQINLQERPRLRNTSKEFGNFIHMCDICYIFIELETDCKL